MGNEQGQNYRGRGLRSGSGAALWPVCGKWSPLSSPICKPVARLFPCPPSRRAGGELEPFVQCGVGGVRWYSVKRPPICVKRPPISGWYSVKRPPISARFLRPPISGPPISSLICPDFHGCAVRSKPPVRARTAARADARASRLRIEVWRPCLQAGLGGSPESLLNHEPHCLLDPLQRLGGNSPRPVGALAKDVFQIGGVFGQFGIAGLDRLDGGHDLFQHAFL